MPLIVKDYVWEETTSTVWITVPLKGVKANKEDYTEQMEKIEAMMKRIQGLNDRLKKYQ